MESKQYTLEIIDKKVMNINENKLIEIFRLNSKKIVEEISLSSIIKEFNEMLNLNLIRDDFILRDDNYFGTFYARTDEEGNLNKKGIILIEYNFIVNEEIKMKNLIN